MCDWDSYKYWRSPDRLPHFWYIALCLLMSAIQDRLTGLSLRGVATVRPIGLGGDPDRTDSNLNWATTAFYYSAVHSGRLLCFVCAGDYPTGHADLGKLLSAGEAETQRVRLDWLESFVSYGSPTAGTSVRGAEDKVGALAGALTRAIAREVPKGVELYRRFAPLLPKFKNLRNDSNYEALLVAHEYEHMEVQDGFLELSRAADRTAEIAVELGISAYLAATNSVGETLKTPDVVYRAHNYYLKHRVCGPLSRKFAASSAAREELDRIRAELDRWEASGGTNDHNHDDFTRPIQRDWFSAKQGLMTRWRRDVSALDGELGRIQP